MAKDGEDRHGLGTNNKLEKVGLNFSEYTQTQLFKTKPYSWTRVDTFLKVDKT